MPVYFTATESHHGPTLKLTITMIYKDLEQEKETNSINVHDLALIKVKLSVFQRAFHFNNDHSLAVSVKVKKVENAKIALVPLTITCEDTKIELFCCDQWMEVEVKQILPKCIVKCGHSSSETFNLSIIELNFTAHDTMPVETVARNDLYEDTDFIDFQLQTADGAVDVHKIVLSQHSHMFKAMLRGGEWMETKQGHINIAGVTLETLQHLKKYMYLGTLPDEGLVSLLLFANHYFMDKLKADCIKKLVKVMKPESFNDLVEWAVENKMTDLVKALILYTPDSFIDGVHQLKKNEQLQAAGENK